MRRRVGFAIGAIFVGLLPFVLVEGVLRMTGLGRPSGYQNPFIGFSQLYPLFELDADASQYRTSQYHHYFFGPQSFPAKKGPSTFRAFCLGGSTVLGHPYSTETAFPKWLEIELAGRDPSRHYEIINCGGMSYASYRLIPILEEVINYGPDLIVVMTGHNEFLEDRTYHQLKQRSAIWAQIEDRLLALRIVTLGRHTRDSLRAAPAKPTDKTTFDQVVDARLDHTSGYASYHRDAQWWEGVTNHFALNLRVMVQLCRKADVPLLLICPGSNLRDCPPFKSEHGAGLDPRRLDQWRQFFQLGSGVEASHPTEALALYRKAETIDDQYAELVFRMARCMDRLGRFEQARVAYVRAKELDVCPLRILHVMQQAVLRVAETSATPVVDAAALLEQRSPHGIVGFDWYVDQVHPSIRGQQLIAQAVAQRLDETRLAASKLRPWSKPDRRMAYRHHMDQLGQQYLAAGRRRVQWLEKWARRDRLRDDALQPDARANLDLGHSHVEFAEYEQAKQPYRNAAEQDPTSAGQIVERALQLLRSGRSSDAEKLVGFVFELKPGQSATDQARIALAVLALEAGQTETALQHAKQVPTALSSLDPVSKAWLDELPQARDLWK